MTYLVHGATGAQGAPVLAALIAAGHPATAAVRVVSALHDAPAVAVDLGSLDSLVAAWTGADAVFVHLPLGAPQTQLVHAETIGRALTLARPARVVFSTSGYTTGVPGNERSAPDVVAAHLRSSGLSFAVVEPRLYLENLLLPFLVRPAREEGVLRYPLRADHLTSWSSHLDVADVAVRLLTDHSVTGVVSVGALPALDGDDLAAGFAAHLHRPVTYEALSPERFGEDLVPMFGEQAARPVVDAYAWRWTQPGDVIPEATSAQTLLGLTPRTVAQWLDDVH